MFGFTRDRRADDADMRLDALDRSMATIEFGPDGTIVRANANFLAVMGYRADEIVGRHHSMFVDPAERDGDAYRDFWAALDRGEHQTRQFRRLGKDGREVWIEASYTPLVDPRGRTTAVVKYATDITGRKRKEAERKGQMDAVRRSQAVIEFDLDGTILWANPNFLDAMGYGLEEIRGRHHSMFLDPADRDTDAYRAFWATLRRGEFLAARYRRVGKGGREVWIEASYNPILDATGRPFKVVKFATDVTAQARLQRSLKDLIDRNFAEVDGALAAATGEIGAARRAQDETAATVRTMAEGAGTLAASFAEIAESMTRSRTAADRVGERADTADRSTQRLAEAARSMTGIVELIQRIAGQINLLALNATIEAARAGEAGRGFAVVATEVKTLANQAAQASGRISTEIEGVQGVASDVVAALAGIREAIEEVGRHVADSAAAVETQASVTRGISADMRSTAGAVDTVSHAVGAIEASVGSVGAAVAGTREAAAVLVG